ncbi:MAG TPA: beta-propeller fold lactonase family protein, partial [Methylomirabilota bacterium]|nr:beta-propeller fold lactonase family protein [Methylomirabilota bacterium]
MAYRRPWSLERLRGALASAVFLACAGAAGAQSVQYAYSTNTSSPGALSGFAKSAATGALTAVAGSPFAGGLAPQQIALDPAGKFAYALNPDADSVSMFQVDGTTGALSEVAGSPFGTVFPSGGGTHPQAVAIGGGGLYVYIGNKTGALPNDGSIDVYQVSATAPGLVAL